MTTSPSESTPDPSEYPDSESRLDGTKVCTRCGEAKPKTAEFFHRRLDKLAAHCRTCANEVARAFRARRDGVPLRLGQDWTDKRFREQREDGLRNCSKCGEAKPADKFTRSSSKRDGLHSWCRDCHAADNRRHMGCLGPKPKRPYGEKVFPCFTCKQVKPRTAEFFVQDASHPDGLKTVCRECRRAYMAQRRARVPGHAERATVRELRKSWLESGTPGLVPCSACGIEKVRSLANFFPLKSSIDGLGGRCRECFNAYSKVWQTNQRRQSAEVREKARQDRLATDPQFAMLRRCYLKQREQVEFRLNRSMRAQIYAALGKGRIVGRWQDRVGYTLAELRRHLERQFDKGMTWANMGRGGWHIDHIVPLVSFVFTDTADPEFRAAWALANLRPLWELENISKGAKRTTLL